MFKIGDLVRCINANDIMGLAVVKHYNIIYVSPDGKIVDVNAKCGSCYSYRFELVKDNPMNNPEKYSTNPCIQTEEVKVIKIKIKAGNLDNMHTLVPTDNGINFLRGNDIFFYDTKKLRKLARQLDEIANVLDTEK